MVETLKVRCSETTYRIEPLRWAYFANRNREAWEARAIGGKYRVERWRRDNGRWRGWCWAFESVADEAPDAHPCRTAEEGKALVEADWRETITRFLEEVDHE